MLDTLLQLAGRAHPLLLHLPIGMLVALMCLELLALPQFIKLDSRVRLALVWLVALSAAASVTTGLLLQREPAYTSGGGGWQTLDIHKWLGIGAGVCALLMALCLCSRQSRRLYPLLLLLAIGGIIPAGHFGATMTHGEGFLTKPLYPRQPDPIRGSGEGSLIFAATNGVYPEQIAPIFDRYCASCHNDEKKKGGLILHGPDGIRAGGKTGSAIEPGDPESSEIVFRMRLPAADRDHMPPKGKPQPDAATIRLIEQWIAAGAAFEGGDLLPIEGDAAVQPDSAAPASTPGESLSDFTAPLPPAGALATLRGQQLHAEIIDPAQNLLWVSFDGAASIDDATAARLLAPLTPFIADLSLAGTNPGPMTIAQVANMPALRRLSLSRARFTAIDFVTLADASFDSLQELNLSSAPLDSTAAALLASRFPKLTRVFLWNSGLSDAAIADLRARRPALALELDEPAAAPLETEPALTFSGDAPPPPPATTPAPTAK